MLEYHVFVDDDPCGRTEYRWHGGRTVNVYFEGEECDVFTIGTDDFEDWAYDTRRQHVRHMVAEHHAFELES